MVTRRSRRRVSGALGREFETDLRFEQGRYQQARTEKKTEDKKNARGFEPSGQYAGRLATPTPCIT